MLIVVIPIMWEQGECTDEGLYFGFGSVGGVREEWVGGRGLGPGSGWVGWCYVCVRCEV